MPEPKSSKWLCPICSLKELPFGQGCPLWEKDQCPDAASAHLTGQWYNRERNVIEPKGLGISEISDE